MEDMKRERSPTMPEGAASHSSGTLSTSKQGALRLRLSHCTKLGSRKGSPYKSSMSAARIHCFLSAVSISSTHLGRTGRSHLASSSRKNSNNNMRTRLGRGTAGLHPNPIQEKCTSRGVGLRPSMTISWPTPLDGIRVESLPLALLLLESEAQPEILAAPAGAIKTALHMTLHCYTIVTPVERLQHAALVPPKKLYKGDRTRSGRFHLFRSLRLLRWGLYLRKHGSKKAHLMRDV